jgi:hypothetical protein
MQLKLPDDRLVMEEHALDTDDDIPSMVLVTIQELKEQGCEK